MPGFDLGGVELRLVEPVDKAGDDPYSVCLREKGPGFHHLGIYTEHPAELTARYEEMGLHPGLPGAGGGRELRGV